MLLGLRAGIARAGATLARGRPGLELKSRAGLDHRPGITLVGKRKLGPGGLGDVQMVDMW